MMEQDNGNTGFLLSQCPRVDVAKNLYPSSPFAAAQPEDSTASPFAPGIPKIRTQRKIDVDDEMIVRPVK